MGDTVLNIEIDQNGRTFFYNTKEHIVIVRPYSINTPLKTACLSFRPFPGKNQITFTDKWSLYASTNEIKAMTKIQADSTLKNIALGHSYIFDDRGFNGIDSRHLVNSYGFANMRTASKFISCGLIQDIVGVNNTSIAAITCTSKTPLNQVSYFKPDSIIWVFIAKGITPNMVIPTSVLAPNSNRAPFTSIGPYLEIDLNNTTTIHFDSQTNLFQKGALP